MGVLVKTWVSAAVFIAAASNGLAQDIQLEFPVLPSAQGWMFQTLNPGTLVESDLFSVDGAMLTQATVGMEIGDCGTGGQAYYLYDVEGLALHTGWEIEFEARVTAGENIENIHFGFTTQLELQGYLGGVGISPTALQFPGLATYALDATVWRTYRLEADLVEGTETVFVDGAEVWSGTLDSVTTTGLYFGDRNCRSNANGDTRRYEVRFKGPMSAGTAVETRAWSSTKARFR